MTIDASQHIVDELRDALRRHLAEKITKHGVDEIFANPTLALITYGKLCELAENPVIPRGVGKYLTLLRDEAVRLRDVPLDCLVINQRTRQPGIAYRPDGHFVRERWVVQIQDAIQHFSRP